MRLQTHVLRVRAANEATRRRPTSHHNEATTTNDHHEATATKPQPTHRGIALLTTARPS